MQATNAMEEFQRDFTYRTAMGSGGLILSATMTDRYHDLDIEVTVDPDSMTITAARAEFKRSPTEFCPGVTRRMERLVGMTIGRGMNRRLLDLFGGSEGCGNIRTILSGLLPLALNVSAARGISDEAEMLATIQRRLSGTCAGYPAGDGEG